MHFVRKELIWFVSVALVPVTAKATWKCKTSSMVDAETHCLGADSCPAVQLRLIHPS